MAAARAVLTRARRADWAHQVKCVKMAAEFVSQLRRVGKARCPVAQRVALSQRALYCRSVRCPAAAALSCRSVRCSGAVYCRVCVCSSLVHTRKLHAQGHGVWDWDSKLIVPAVMHMHE